MQLLSAALLFCVMVVTRGFAAPTSLYQFKVNKLGGGEVDLAQFESSPVALIVNTASACGYTPQYEDLQKLYQKYQDQGFTVLGFPCNQFGAQEPGSADEIKTFTSGRFGVTFPLMEKIEVNGPNEHPLFSYLKSATNTSKVQWNFNKWLVVKGVPKQQYSHSTPPMDIENDIVAALQEVSQSGSSEL